MTPVDTLARAADEFENSALASRVERRHPLAPHTTYRVGGPADLFVCCDTRSQLDEVARIVARTRIDTLVVGNGSNLLVADAGFRGLAIALGAGFDWVTIDGTTVRAGAASRLPVLARRSVAAGLAGFEWAVGVPGTVGGSVRMNAGGHGGDIARALVRCEVVNLRQGRHVVRSVAELDLGYRHSNIGPADVVVDAEFELGYGDRASSEQLLDEIVRWRRENQPGGQNAGSVFANPPGDAAGRLIDVAGCKGLRVGSAHVSVKHANFFQVDDGGSADDVRALMRQVQRRVRERTGVELVPETRLVGFAGDRP